MTTTVYEDLSDEGTHEVEIRIRSCTPSETPNRAFELDVEDRNGTRFPFIVWEKSTQGRHYNWQRGQWYRLRGVTANVWPNGKVLHGASKLQIEELGASRQPREATLLYFTDSHLGKTKHSFGLETWSVSPASGFKKAIDLAVTNDVDAVIHGGDLFHNSGDGINEADVETCREGLVSLATNGIPFYFIHGNHEREAGRLVMQTFVDDGLAAQLGPRYELVNDAVALYGVDFCSQWTDSVLELEPVSEGVASILCLHQSISPFTSTQVPDCDLEQIHDACSVPIDLVVNGHVHTRVEEQVGDLRGISGGATTRVGSASDDLAPSVELIHVEHGTVNVERLILTEV